MGVQEKLLTVEEFWEQYAGKPYELVEGVVVAVAPAGGTHGATIGRPTTQLGTFVHLHELGEVFGAETGFQLGPKIMRGADAAFVRQEKLEQVEEPDKYIPFAPDLAVEVVSPNDTANEVQTKVKEYLAAGTLLVWVMYPETKQVVVHQPGGAAKTSEVNDTLDGGQVLPGLKIAVSDLFPKKK
jgi:Uma2 family endonuclease